jgi:fumarylpyruvate hydrolase
VRGKTERLPVNRLFFVGRNYHAHAWKWASRWTRSVSGRSTSPSRRRRWWSPAPPWPTRRETKNYHFEMELVLAIGKPGFRVKAETPTTVIYGYACGLDMTRRDLQLVARDKGRPWDLGKDVEQSSVCAEIVPMPGVVIEHGEIALAVNGETKQRPTSTS